MDSLYTLLCRILSLPFTIEGIAFFQDATLCFFSLCKTHLRPCHVWGISWDYKIKWENDTVNSS